MQPLPGPRFNIKMSSYRYRKSHCGDKTVVRSSYLHNGISYTSKMSSLYWIGAQDVIAVHMQTKSEKYLLYYIMRYFIYWKAFCTDKRRNNHKQTLQSPNQMSTEV